MLIAALGDCNGNAAALRAALDAIAAEGILTIFQTGNLAGPGGADKVIALLEEHGAMVCQGEMDRLLLRFEQKAEGMRNKLDPETFAALAAAHAGLSSKGIEYLRGLHKRVERSMEGVRILACHGSPASQQEIVDASTAHARLQRHREAAGAEIILCGGAPDPFHRWVDGTLFVGPGSLAPAGNDAYYLLISTEADPWQVELRTVSQGME